jgi:hypothetical protein
MPMRARIAIAVAIIAAAGPAFAGAWTMPQGKGQVVITATGTQADQSFDSRWRAHETPRYRKLDLPALIEYGINERLTAIVIPSLQHIDIAAPTDATRTGLGYTEFGARYRWLTVDDWVFSTQGTMRIPGTTNEHNPAAVGYTGPEFDARALLGKSFNIGALPAFIDLQVAQRFRGGGMPNEFRADATFGVRTATRWLWLLQSFNVVSEATGSVLFPSYNYSKLQLSVVYDISKAWSVQAGAISTYAGRNALQENGFVFGLWYRF